MVMKHEGRAFIEVTDTDSNSIMIRLNAIASLHDRCDSRMIGLSSGEFVHTRLSMAGIEERLRQAYEWIEQQQTAKPDETISFRKSYSGSGECNKRAGGLTPVSTPFSSEDLTARDLIQVLNSIFCAVMETSSDINKKISPQNLLKVMKALELLMKPSD
ncbi:hypothetical protein AU861_08585 [Salmonella enterica subsp. enterica serovar Infantis]|uniref:Uncharacterized protein n=3 Tax=root TaxID=1 RepID=A0A0M3ULB0_9CAUD|nr:hypothetical protein SEN5_33 [Salmonella phage SEN5]YP_009218848.1 hypothetical protein SEN4_33 [Salmonella phage SEN4]EAM7382126.1 hypothetical protein [Salmonella enterica]EBH3545278.1 hypothetical protein [Salmonella enterica subsp. enterica serovar Infantis]EBO2950147.1 hypothetical protein [Salmonella enterica subsp. enterica serovar Newport]EBV6515816.1 hypothetical protein [Salmonella enterica subsp. enterica serovar Emek]ECB7116660.1 hypothetical protein [Salmonella enterica subsp.